MFLKYLYVIFLLTEPSYKFLLLFMLLSIPLLVAAHHFLKGKKEKLWSFLCAIPMVFFLLFYARNRITGYEDLTFRRLAAPGLIALIILLWGVLVFFKRSYKAYAVLVSIFSVFLLVLGLTALAVLFERVYVGNHTHDGWEKSLEKTIDDLAVAYVLRDWKEYDYDALKEKYLPLAREAEKNRDKVAMIMALYELRYELNDAHISLRIKDTAAEKEALDRLAGNDYGFSMFRDEAGEFLAVLVEEDGEAAAAGILEGTVITKWDGTAVSEAVKNVKCIDRNAFSYLENEQFFQPVFLAGQGGDTIQVTFLDKDMREQTVTLHANGSYRPRRTEAIDRIYCTHKLGTENYATCMLNDHIGYLRITEESYLGDPPMDVIKAALAGYSKKLYDDLNGKLEALKAQGMTALILDVRCNGGGYGFLTKAVVGLFTDQPQPCDVGYYADNTYHTLSKPKEYGTGPWKDLPLAVLVNGDTCSAGDLMAYFLQSQCGATLIGSSTTWGSAQSTGGMAYLTDGEFTLRIPIALSPTLEGEPAVDARGDRKARFLPDVVLTYPPEDVLELFRDGGRDVELEKALEYVESMTR